MLYFFAFLAIYIVNCWLKQFLTIVRSTNIAYLPFRKALFVICVKEIKLLLSLAGRLIAQQIIFLKLDAKQRSTYAVL